MSFVADQIASNAITTVKILDNAVTTAKIVDDAVTTAKILDDNITTAKILDANVTAGKLGTGSVVEAKLGAGAVTNSKIGALAVDTAELAADCIDGTKVADLAIDTEHLAASAVETAKINALAVTTAKIADNAITSAKIAAGTIVDSDVNASAAIALTKLATLPMTVDGSTTVTGSIPMNSNKFTGLTDGEAASQDSCTVAQMQTHVVDALAGNEWHESVLTRLAAPPGSPDDDARYLIIATATGAWAGKEDQIAQWDDSGSQWEYKDPDTGSFVSVDDETTVLYYYGGSSWSTKSFEATTASTGLTKSGVDIQLASAAAGDGLSFSAGTLAADFGSDKGLKIASNKLEVELASTPGLEFSTGLQINRDTETGATVAAVNVSTNGVGMVVDNSTVVHSSNALAVGTINNDNCGGLTTEGQVYISNGTNAQVGQYSKIQETTQDGTGNWTGITADDSVDLSSYISGIYGAPTVFYNGMQLEEGVGKDYTITGDTTLNLERAVTAGLAFEVLGFFY